MSDLDKAEYLVFAAPGGFTPAVVLGQGLPAEVLGEPCHYAWKEALPLGDWQYPDETGAVKTVSITAARRDNLLSNFKALRASGFRPRIPDGHKTREAGTNYGFVVDARTGKNGSLELLHQFIGDDAKKTAARNDSSVCIKRNFQDAKGKVYDEVIEHNALTPDPFFTNLGGFEPALAASRGLAAPAVVLHLAAHNGSTDMPLIDTLGKSLGIAEPTEDKISAAVAKLVEDKNTADTALTASRTELATVKTAKEQAETAKKAAEDKVLTFERPIDAGLLKGFARIADMDVDHLVKDGKLTPAAAEHVKKVIRTSDGQPNALMFSRDAATDHPYQHVLAAFSANAKVIPGKTTPSDTVIAASRTIPGGESDPATTLKASRDEGAAWQKEQLQARGL